MVVVASIKDQLRALHGTAAGVEEIENFAPCLSLNHKIKAIGTSVFRRRPPSSSRRSRKFFQQNSFMLVSASI
ncbi:hypothetical protein GBA52_007832 [Prunus armeniaca]|nr:hypothetical protein GBA52_007832 [Prunus armeniaca]